jgi:hypothetical protein
VRKSLGSEFSCDICSATFQSENFPLKELTQCSFEARTPGWTFFQNIDICKNCWSTDGYFSDPPSNKRLKSGTVKNILSYFLRTKDEK